MMCRSSTRRRADRGFSLIEVSVVVAVLGLMVSIGFPAMQEWLDRYRVRNAASEIASAIQLQRMRAVSQNQEFSIEFDAAAGTYALYQGDPDTGTMLDAVARGMPFGVTYQAAGDAITAPNDRILFHPDGSMNDSTAVTDTIRVGNASGDAFAVSVNRATGRVLVELQGYGS